MGAFPPGSWLPALPGGGSLGPKPADLHQRYLSLNKTFADAWRVTDKTSLFDYSPGTSTATFTLAGWPKENPPCDIPKTTPVKPLPLKIAQRLCRPIVDKARNANCVFDVRVTGEPGFAKAYQTTQRIENGATTTTLSVERNPAKPGEPALLLATVARRRPAKGVPAGSVQFLIDGEKAGAPVQLDPAGRAVSRAANLRPGRHQVVATYLPARGTLFLASTSRARTLLAGDQVGAVSPSAQPE